MAEKERSHSQDVTGRVPRILRATLMFANESKLIALSVDATLLGHELLLLTQYVCHNSNSPSGARGFGKSSFKCLLPASHSSFISVYMPRRRDP